MLGMYPARAPHRRRAEEHRVDDVLAVHGQVDGLADRHVVEGALRGVVVDHLGGELGSQGDVQRILGVQQRDLLRRYALEDHVDLTGADRGLGAGIVGVDDDHQLSDRRCAPEVVGVGLEAVALSFHVLHQLVRTGSDVGGAEVVLGRHFDALPHMARDDRNVSERGQFEAGVRPAENEGAAVVARHHEVRDPPEVPGEPAGLHVVDVVVDAEVHVVRRQGLPIVPGDALDHREGVLGQVRVDGNGVRQPRLRNAVGVELHERVVLEHQQVPSGEAADVGVRVEGCLVAGDRRPYRYRSCRGLLLHHRLVEHLLGLCESRFRGGQRLLGGFSRRRSPLLGFLERCLRVGQRGLGSLVALHGCRGRSLGCVQIGLGLGQCRCRRFGLRLSRLGLRLSRLRLRLGGRSIGLGGRSLCLRRAHFVRGRVLAATRRCHQTEHEDENQRFR